MKFTLMILIGTYNTVFYCRETFLLFVSVKIIWFQLILILRNIYLYSSYIRNNIVLYNSTLFTVTVMIIIINGNKHDIGIIGITTIAYTGINRKRACENVNSQNCTGYA